VGLHDLPRQDVNHNSHVNTVVAFVLSVGSACDFNCVTFVVGRAMAQVVSHRPLTAEARVNPRGICGGQSGTGTDFSPSSSVFPVNISLHRRSPNSYHLGNV
jgi:hypothetical protein